MADAAGGRGDQCALAQGQPGRTQGAQRHLSAAHQQQGSRVGHVARDGCGDSGLKDGELGIGTGEGQPGGSLADLPARYPGADRGHVPHDFTAWRMRERHWMACGGAVREPHDRQGDACGFDLDQQLAVAWFGPGRFLEAQHLRAAVLIEADPAHS